MDCLTRAGSVINDVQVGIDVVLFSLAGLMLGSSCCVMQNLPFQVVQFIWPVSYIH